MTNFKYSQTSLERLYTCHSDLITICKTAIVISPIDISVVCGHRDKEAQNKAYNENRSDFKWPHSMHNQTPSKAVDLAPYIDGRIQWKHEKGLYLIAGLVIGIGYKLGIKIRWGGAWNGTLNTEFQRKDLYHFEKME